MQTPESLYKSSDRHYPIPWTSPRQTTVEQALVNDTGTILFGRGRGRRIFIAHCLAGRVVGLDFVAPRIFEVKFVRGLVQPRQRGYKKIEMHVLMYENSNTSGENMFRRSEATRTGHRAGQNGRGKVSTMSPVEQWLWFITATHLLCNPHMA